MPKNLSNNIQEKKNAIEVSTPWVSLLAISIGGQVFRITDDNQDVVYQNETYTSFPFNISTIKQTTDGKIPSLNVSISNVEKVLMQYVEGLNGLVDSKVTLTVINTAIPDENYEELTMEFSVTGAEVDEEWVVFTLGAPNPLRQRFPKDRYIAYSCPWTFNSPSVRSSGSNEGAECNYQGADTSCKKTYADCKSKGNEARFGGFFGLSEDGFRVV
jgi:phage-related protein